MLLFFRQPRSFSRVSLLLVFASAFSLRAQETVPLATPTPNRSSEVPKVPGLSLFLTGFNFGVSVSGIHDAQTGWAVLSQPAVGYSYKRFSIDATIPIYLYRLAESHALSTPINERLSPQQGDLGDLLFGVHAQFLPHGFGYQATFSASAPTGDVDHGLSTGHPTFDISNHFERAFRRVSPEVEFGIGNSSTLVNQLVARNFTSLGSLAHFQAGFAFPLPRGMSFETNAYEQLPIGDQKIYETIGDRNGHGPVITIVTGHSVSEDNGFTNAFAMPLTNHITASGYYNRSLRLHDDVVSFGLSYVFRSLRSSPRLSDDDLLRAIQQEIQAPATAR